MISLLAVLSIIGAILLVQYSATAAIILGVTGFFAAMMAGSQDEELLHTLIFIGALAGVLLPAISFFLP